MFNLTGNLKAVTSDTLKELISESSLTSDFILFEMEGEIFYGYYHCNGYFYQMGGKLTGRSFKTCELGPQLKLPIVTSFCFFKDLKLSED